MPNLVSKSILLPKEDHKESQLLAHLKGVMLRKNHFASIVKMRNIWQKNVTDHNNADHVGKQAIDGIPILISDITDAMKWAM